MLAVTKEAAMEYKIGQTFIDEYQPEAAVW